MLKVKTTSMNNKENTIIDIDELIPKLQSKDSENMKLTRVMQFTFTAIILLFSTIFIINPYTESGINFRLSSAFCIAGFGIFFLYFSYYYQQYKRVNYSESVRSVLQSAVKRFKFWHSNIIISFIAIILICIGIGYMIIPILPEPWSYIIAILSVLLFLGAFSSGFYVGYKQWLNDSKPLWIAANNLLEELK